MGFDTTLEIGDRQALGWRKYASSEPRLLFAFDQRLVEDSTDDDGEHYWRVGYQSTVGKARGALSECGYSWKALVDIYSDLRERGGYAVGMYWGKMLAELGGGQKFEIEEAIEKFRKQDPEPELRALATLMAAEYLNPDSEVTFIDDMSYDGTFERSGSYLFSISDRARLLEDVDEFDATRAAEAIFTLLLDAPLLAWPVVIGVLLHGLDLSMPVVLDLSGDAAEQGVDSSDSAFAYLDEYWVRSTKGLSEFAQAIGRMFSTLAAFESKLGHDFWLSAAAERLGHLESLSGRSDVTTKVRGDALEAVAEALVRTEEPNLSLVEKNFRTSEEEIDLIFSNNLSDPYWLSYSSPVIFIECKNHTTPVGVPDLRVFESKMADRKAICRVGIFVSFSGFTQTFLERLKSVQGDFGIIFAVSGEDMKMLLSTRRRLTDWLRTDGISRALGKQG